MSVNAFEVREGLGVTDGMGGFAAGEAGEPEADVEQSSDAT